MEFLNVNRPGKQCLFGSSCQVTFGSSSKLMETSWKCPGTLVMSQIRGCKYISFWKKRLSPVVGHAGYHLVLIFQADFMILLQVFGRIGSILV